MARAIVPAAEEIVDRYFPVHDHGFVALVDYMGDDQRIIDSARTSYGLGTRRVSEDRWLGRYLYRQRHTTPIEMCELLFHVKMPIFAARQWIRHRMSTVNEYSGRYSLMPMMFYMPKSEHVTTQSTTNRQGRSTNELQLFEYESFKNSLLEQRALAQENYEEFVGEFDVAREIARMDLPLSLYTEWYWKIDAHNLSHFLGQRCDAHAQYEIRAYANIIAGMLHRVTPNLTEAWLDYHPNMGGALLSRQEIGLLRRLVYREYGYAKPDGAKNPLLQLNSSDREDASISAEQMTATGMSMREIEAFVKLFDRNYEKQLPSLELDLRVTKDAGYFAEQTRLHTPNLEEKK